MRPAVFVTTLLLLTAVPATAQLYSWTDANGTVYYTTDKDSIPEAYRETARDIGSPTPGPIEAPPAPAGMVVPYTGGPLVIDAVLNDVPLRLILDTGAERTLISPAALARAGIDVTGGTPVNIRGVTGEAAATLVAVPRLDVAGTRLGPLPVVVHAIAGETADGLLGRDVLDLFTITVDAANRRALLTPR